MNIINNCATFTLQNDCWCKCGVGMCNLLSWYVIILLLYIFICLCWEDIVQFWAEWAHFSTALTDTDYGYQLSASHNAFSIACFVHSTHPHQNRLILCLWFFILCLCFLFECKMQTAMVYHKAEVSKKKTYRHVMKTKLNCQIHTISHFHSTLLKLKRKIYTTNMQNKQITIFL